MGNFHSKKSIRVFSLVTVVVALGQSLRADIPTTSGGVVAGTEGITPGPGIDLSNWNTPGHDLGNALLHFNLTGANFQNSDLTNAQFQSANVTNADFTGANIQGALFGPGSGMSLNQLLSTASYANKDFSGLQLYNVDISDFYMVGFNLTNAVFHCNLADANFAGTTINGITIFAPDFNAYQLSVTASYVNHDLSNVHLDQQGMVEWNFSNQNLTGASFDQADITDSSFDGAIVNGTSFQGTKGLTPDQIYSTTSYIAHDLSNIILVSDDLTGWSFTAQNLTGANFFHTTLTNADFTGANIKDVTFGQTRSRPHSFIPPPATNNRI